MTANSPRPHVIATFPASSEYADYVLRIERPLDDNHQPVFDQGWDILYQKKDGSAFYNHWADDWDEVRLFFADEQASEGAPAWVWVGKFKDAIFPEGDED